MNELDKELEYEPDNKELKKTIDNLKQTPEADEGSFFDLKTLREDELTNNRIKGD